MDPLTDHDVRIVHVSARIPNAIYIGRSGQGLEGPFGNPYSTGGNPVYSKRLDVLERYRKHLRDRCCTDLAFRVALLNLRGATLMCFCPRKGQTLTRLDVPLWCHGQIIGEWLHAHRDEVP